MKTKQILTKYVILLLVSIVTFRFIAPYCIKLFFSWDKNTLHHVLNINYYMPLVTLSALAVNLIFAVFMLIDTKAKQTLDWLIILVTLIRPETGITVFIGWKIYQGTMELKES